MEIRTITNWDEFNELKNDWNRLFKLDPYSTIFQSFDWHDAWWQAFGHAYKLSVLVAKKEGKIIGIAPLMTEKNTIKFLTASLGEYQDFIIDKSHLQARQELLNYLITNYSSYIIELHEVRLTSPLGQLLSKLAQANPKALVQSSASFQVQLNKPFNKRDIKARHKKLAARGQIDYKQINATDIPLALDSFFKWHRVRFENDLSKHRHLQLREEFKKFYLNLSRIFKADTKLPALSLDRAPISYLFGLANRHTFYDLLPSFNPKLLNFSPGSILLQEIINTALAEGIKTFDLLRGGESYKLRFANTTTPLLRLTIYSNKLSLYKAQLARKIKKLIKPLIFFLFSIFKKTKQLFSFKIFKKVIFALVYFSGLAWLYLKLSKKRQRILCYHSISDHPLALPELAVSPQTFDQQMRYIKKLQITNHKLQITFDDGYQDNYTNAYPNLKKYNLTAAIFPTTDFIEQGFIPSWKDEPDFPAVTWDNLQEMIDSKVFKIGSHTVSHPILSELSDQEIESELNDSKTILESGIMNPASAEASEGRQELSDKLEIRNYPEAESGSRLDRDNLEINSLAYPFGTPNDVNQRVKKIAKSLGYTHGYTLTEGTNPEASGLSLKRLVIFDEPMYMFKARLSGITDDTLNFLKRLISKV